MQVDFKLYLDSVGTSSQRSRSLLYLLIVALISTFCAMRHTDTLFVRFKIFERAYQYIVANKKEILTMSKSRYESLSPQDQGALNYVGRVLGTTNMGESPGLALLEQVKQNADPDKPISSTEWPVEQLRSYLDEYRKLALEGRTLNLPVSGSQIDVTDVALVAGAVYTTLLYLLALSFRRERINLNIARLKAESLDPENLQLLIMTQVLSPVIVSSEQWAKHSKVIQVGKAISKLPLFATIVLPGLLMGILWFQDLNFQTIAITVAQFSENALVGGFAILSLVLVAVTIKQFVHLNAEIVELEKSANQKRKRSAEQTGEFPIV
jgi:hypothetical protein